MIYRYHHAKVRRHKLAEALASLTQPPKGILEDMFEPLRIALRCRVSISSLSTKPRASA